MESGTPWTGEDAHSVAEWRLGPLGDVAAQLWQRASCGAAPPRLRMRRGDEYAMSRENEPRGSGRLVCRPKVAWRT
jgi:hypothetical protein